MGAGPWATLEGVGEEPKPGGVFIKAGAAKATASASGHVTLLIGGIRQADVPVEQVRELRDQIEAGASEEELERVAPWAVTLLRELQRHGATLQTITTVLSLVLAIMAMRQGDEQGARSEGLQREQVRLEQRQLEVEEQRLEVERERLEEERQRTGSLTDAEMRRIAEEFAQRMAAEEGRR